MGVMVTGWLLVAAGVGPGCGVSVAPGAPCDDIGEQACADNKELVCEGDFKWELAEDCDGAGKTCVINAEGDADCE